MKLDAFTVRRLQKFISDFRQKSGQLPTLKDLEGQGFSKEQIDRAVKDKIIESFYVTLTNGTILKGFKLVTKI